MSTHPFRLGVAFLLLVLACSSSRAAAADFPRSAQNGSLRLTVEAVKATTTYGGTAAPEGWQWCVVRGRWENRIDAKRATERQLATMVDIGDLGKHLYLVVDGAALGRLHRLAGGDGRHSLDAVTLAKPGASIAGDMVFAIPAGAYVSADLRFYDDIAGYFALALAGSAPAGKPVGPVVRNQVGEFAVFGVTDPAEAPAGAVVPHGCRSVSVELRARSIWKTSGDAPSYDFSQPPGAQVERINLLDWPGTHQSFMLVADGEYAFTPVGGTLPDEARFLPEFFTGGSLVFFVPTEAKSLELVGTLGHAGTAEGVVDFAPLRLPVAGGQAEPLAWTMPLQLVDEMFRVAVGARRAASFAGEAAGEGQEFLVLDVGVENTAAGAEYFQPESQLQLADPEGGAIGCDEVTWRGPHRPERELYVPGGGRRRCELVFRVASGVSPRLSFTGSSSLERYVLPEAR